MGWWVFLGWHSQQHHVATRVSCAKFRSVRANAYTYAFCEHDFRTSISSKSSAKSGEHGGVCVRDYVRVFA